MVYNILIHILHMISLNILYFKCQHSAFEHEQDEDSSDSEEEDEVEVTSIEIEKVNK